MTHWMGNPNTATAPTCEEPGCMYASAHMWKNGPWFAFYCTEHFPTHEQARLDALRGPR